METTTGGGGGGGGGGGVHGRNVAGGRVTGGIAAGTVVGAAVVVVGRGRGRVVVVVVGRVVVVIGARSGSTVASLATAAPQLESANNAIPTNAARTRRAFPPCIRGLPFPRSWLQGRPGNGPVNWFGKGAWDP